jgi:hypothetical protein
MGGQFSRQLRAGELLGPGHEVVGKVGRQGSARDKEKRAIFLSNRSQSYFYPGELLVWALECKQ